MGGFNIPSPAKALSGMPLYADVEWHPNGTVTVTSSTYIKGRGVAQIERTDTGTFKVTFEDRFYRLRSFSATRAYGTAGNNGDMQVTAVGDIARGNTGSTYVTMVWKVANSATDVSYSTSDFFLLQFGFEGSSVDG